MLRSDWCDYNHTSIAVKGKITVEGDVFNNREVKI